MLFNIAYLKRNNNTNLSSRGLENLTCFMKTLDFSYDEKLRCGRHRVYLNDERADEKKGKCRERIEKNRERAQLSSSNSIDLQIFYTRV